MAAEYLANLQARSVDVHRIRIAGAFCAATALASAVVLGGLESWHTVFSGTSRYALTPAAPAQLWVYGILQAVKAFAFSAALVGVWWLGTRRGLVATVMIVLAAAGAVFFAVVWILIAMTGRDDALYVAGRAIGSDGRTNGGLLFLWLAPVVLGISALVARRVPRWQAVWLIATGILGARLFGMLPVSVAFLIEGVLWGVVGWIVYSAARTSNVSYG
jgi:hypothetical protein